MKLNNIQVNSDPLLSNNRSILRGSLAELPQEDRLAAEERLKEMADREKPQKKGGLLSRLRDTSHSRKK